MVVNPEVSSVRDADRIIGLLEAREVRENFLVINRLRPRMVARGTCSPWRTWWRSWA